jgi:iron(III) transport system permease protein
MTVLPVVMLLMSTFMKVAGFFDVPGGAWTLRHWSIILTDRVFLLSLRNTVIMALGAAILSTVFCALLAYMVVRMRSRARAVIDFLTWIPYVFPGIVLALAWLWILLQTPVLRPLYGSVAALILVSGLGGVTLAVQMIKSSLLQMGNEMEEASAIAGAGWFRTLTRIVLPLIAPTLAVVWILSFVSAAGSAVIPAMLATAPSRTLSLLQLEHVLSGLNESAAVVGVLVVVLTIGVAVLARLLGFRVGVGRA